MATGTVQLGQVIEQSTHLPVGLSLDSKVLTDISGTLYSFTIGDLVPLMGVQGSQGVQGTTGVQGVQGTTGPQGSQGIHGTTGPQGPFGGPTGPTGPQGVTGAFGGPQGYQGSAGPQGSRGPQGFQGDIGQPSTIQGPTGITGPQGYQGYQGYQGFQGPQGYQGFTGPQRSIIYRQAGITNSDPTVLVTGLTFTASSCEVSLYSDTTFSGIPEVFTVPQASFTASDDSVNYLYVDYNNGTPVYMLTSDVSLINESNTIPVNTMLASNGYLHLSHWDRLADGLPNKLHRRFVKTQRYARESGLILSTGVVIGPTGLNSVNISSGIVWRGARSFDLGQVNSSGTNDSIWYFFYTTATGTWTDGFQGPSYNFTQYDGRVTGLISMSNQGNKIRHNINWVYRGIEDHNHGYYVLSDKQYDDLPSAIAETKIPTISPLISSHAMLVGRIICRNGTTAPVWIEGAFDSTFVGTTINDHNSLGNLQGGAAGEYYHLTNNQYSSLPVFGTGPTASNSTGTPNHIIIDDNYIYVCVGTNSWKRSQLSAW